MAKPLRDTMPTVAGWIDELRDAFGADTINASIRAGMQGQPTFWASENGQEIGVKDERRGITLAECQIGPFSPANANHRGRQ